MTQQILFLKQAVSAALIATLLAVTTFVLFEPALLRAQTDNVVVTLTVTGGITISDGSDITMAPAISLTAATSTGSTSWTVVTNDPDGYTLDVRAIGTPAMQSAGGANTIADYTEATPNTPDLWNVPNASNTAEFGFTAYGTDVADGTYGSQSACDSGTLDDGVSLYEGLTTSDQTIASRSATTSQSGITTTFCVAVEQTGTYTIPSDVYTAEIIATATVQ